MVPSRMSVGLLVITLGLLGLVGCPASSAGGGAGGASGSGGTKGSGGITGSGGVNGSGGGGGGTGGGSGSGGSSGSGGVNGSGGSNGTGGGSGGSTGTGGAAGPCTAPGIIVCDTFDATPAGGPASSAKWDPPMPSDATPPVVDTARFHSAPNSVRVQGTSIGRGSFLVPVSGLPTANNKVFVRAWVNFQKATSAVTGHNGFIVGAAARDNSLAELRLGISTPPGFSAPMVDLNLQAPGDGGGEVTRFSNGYTTGADPLNQAGLSLDADHWYCVEAMFDGANSEFRVWIDKGDGSGSVENTALHVTDFRARPTDPARTTWGPSYKFVKIGAQNYSGDIGQIWYDDVAVGTQMIGCNP